MNIIVAAVAKYIWQPIAKLKDPKYTEITEAQVDFYGVYKRSIRQASETVNGTTFIIIIHCNLTIKDSYETSIWNSKIFHIWLLSESGWSSLETTTIIPVNSHKWGVGG